MRDICASSAVATVPAPSRRLAVSVGLVLAVSAQAAFAESATSGLEEILVTASRREQNVLETPYNISALSGADVSAAGVTSLQGLERIVPGLFVPDMGSRGNSTNSSIVLRGMSTGDQTNAWYVPFASVPLVSTYVDDVAMFTNLTLSDLARVEVLRGPQGTLYGSGSVAGTVKLIHNQPDPTKFDANVTVEAADVSHADAASYRAEGLVNVPLNENAALRLSAGYTSTAGFIDAPAAMVFDSNGDPVLANPGDPLNSAPTFRSVQHIDDFNSTFARASLLWNIGSKTSVVLAYHHQKDNSDGLSADTIGTKYQRQSMIPHEPMDRTVDLGSLTATADLGFATVTSSTSFYNTTSDSIADVSFALEQLDALFLTYGGYPRLTGPMDNGTDESAFSQEIRLVSNGGGDWDYAVGAFFRHAYDTLTQIQYLPGIGAWSELPGSAAAVNAAYGTDFSTFADFQETIFGAPRPSAIVPKDAAFFYTRRSSFLDRAVYGELTRHLTPKWQATVGTRFFWQSYKQSMTQSLPYGGLFFSTLDPPDSYGSSAASESRTFNDHLLKFNTSYVIGDAARVYATYSEGFRHGGANAVSVGECALCDNADIIPYKSDTAQNYEVGIKGETADHRFRYTADVYLVNWKDVQVQSSGASFQPLVVNGGTARTEGVELELSAQLSERWYTSLGYNYTDAKYTSDAHVVSNNGFDVLLVKDGDPLPNAPKNMATGVIEYSQGFGSGNLLVLHADANYHSRTYTVRGPLDGYATANASATAHWGEHMSTRLFVDNISDGYHVTAFAGPMFDERYNVNFLARPRTIGLTVNYTF